MERRKDDPESFPAILHERKRFRIVWSMEYLDAYLIRETEKKTSYLPFFRPCAGRLERFSDRDEETEVTFVLVPSRLLDRPEKLEKQLLRDAACRPPRGLVWYEDRLRRALYAGRPDGGKGTGAGKAEMGETEAAAGSFLPERFFCSLLYREQPFRENVILFLPEAREHEAGRLPYAQEEWVRGLLEEKSGRLNGLLLVSPVFTQNAGSVPLMEDGSWFGRIYQETGLPVIGAGRLPEYFRDRPADRTACIDAGLSGPLPVRSLPEGTLYLDMTSDAGKERTLYAKRRDVRYVSLRMYLDTYVRKRYNTNRCKMEEKDRRHLPSGAFKVMKRKGNEDGRKEKYPYL